MDEKALKKWRKFRDSCKDCFDKPEQGMQCAKILKKCSFVNCPHNLPPIVSDGDGNSDNRGVDNLGVEGVANFSNRQLEALRYKNGGKTSSEIAVLMKISRQAVDKLLFKANAKMGVASKPTPVARTEKSHRIQLHNDNISFEIYPINVTRIKGKLVKLKHISYRQVTTEDYALKFYPQKLIVQFRKDIEGDSVEEVKREANQRIAQFLSTYPFRGIQFRNKQEQLQRHYAILGTDLAKKYAKEGRKLLIIDKWDGVARITVDLSDGFHRPHFEALHPTKGDFDAERWHHLIEDATHNDVDLMSITKFKVDKAMEAVSTFAEQQGAYAEEIAKHRAAIEKMNQLLDKLNKKIDNR